MSTAITLLLRKPLWYLEQRYRSVSYKSRPFKFVGNMSITGKMITYILGNPCWWYVHSDICQNCNYREGRWQNKKL